MVRLWHFTLWNVDYMHANWQIRGIWIAGHVAVWEIDRIQHCFNGCAYQRRPQILAAIFRDMVICDVFTAAAATENMSGFILLPLQSFASVLTNQLIVAKYRQLALNLLIDSHYIFIFTDNSHKNTSSWMAKTLLRTSQHLIPVIACHTTAPND